MASGDNTVYDNALGKTDLLDGKTIGIALTTAAYLPNTSDTTIDAITGEATGTGYARQTFTCTILDHVCNIATADHWPTFDTSALATHHDRVVLYLGEDVAGLGTTGDLISNIFYGDQAPSASWLAELVNGFAAPRRTPVVPTATIDDAGLYLRIDDDGNYAKLPGTSGAALPVGGLLVSAVDGVVDLASAAPAAAYYAEWETGLTVNLPAAPGSDRLSLALLDTGGGLGVPSFTVEGGGAVTGPSTPDITGSGYELFLSPGPSAFAGFADWTYIATPYAISPASITGLTAALTTLAADAAAAVDVDGLKAAIATFTSSLT